MNIGHAYFGDKTLQINSEKDFDYYPHKNDILHDKFMSGYVGLILINCRTKHEETHKIWKIIHIKF